MSVITLNGSALGTPLLALLNADSIQPGSDASYQLCKTIYLYHPLGLKMVASPVRMAMSQKRDITIPKAPEERAREAFLAEWEKLGADKHIESTMTNARIYGIASLIYGAVDKATDAIIDPEDLSKLELYFNVLDPLNTSGSLVLNQDPNAPDFQKYTNISVAGKSYHRSRSVVIMNEEPVYIAYSTSAFGYVGRSVYQRALFPLKSFVQSMVTDDMVTKKAGLIITKMKQIGSIADGVMKKLAGIKRSVIKDAQTDNVVSIGIDESVEAIDMTNTDTGMTTARKNILENVAVAADMPAKLLNSETFAEGFGEGTEDAKNIARFIDNIREQMRPLYDFFDNIVMYRAWNPEFYKTIQAEFPKEYGDVDYKTAFFQWKNSFKAAWPSLLIEPESEQIKVEEVKLKSLISAVEVMIPALDPDNKATVIQWLADNFNEQKLLFSNPLILDIEALRAYVPPMLEAEPSEPKPAAL